jgi:uncharacterized protein YndB with AHSA1/START domain
VPDEKLVFAWGATDGWPKLDPEQLEDSPTVTVTPSKLNGRTEMPPRERPAGFSDERVQEWWSMGIRDGWRDSIDRLVTRLVRSPGV